ncbi:zinc finger MYM-type protein 3 isoform X2 [Oenanthe melanoleuca]|uniref:zinc finger MYM-type protein 3 isoform X2 n=1 Tax=Oenanthe melanoleuca TaxID=2939378 RepID=UPI0024C12815|nr:zinc finger MYM-type protein 3 isoform X2 [Oenanthe melanoleuca]XP_056347640.1 zinc finger MYM-type protein 3 isoform X2 [Oenanthe melanoleuca]
MDSSEFAGSLDPLSLPDKPLIGDLPADMEFGEDLLGSQTASTQEVSVLQPPGWDQSKQMTADEDLGLVVKADSVSELNKSNDCVLDKPGILNMPEKPGVLDDLGKTSDLVELDKPEDLDGLCKAQPSQDVEGRPADSSALSREAVDPETEKEGEDAPKNRSGDVKEDDAVAIPTMSVDNPPESPQQTIPDSRDLSSAPAREETTAQSSSPTVPPPQLSLKQTKKMKLKAPRKSSPVQREGLAREAEGQLSPDNRTSALPSEPVEEKQTEEGDDNRKNSLKENNVLKAQEALPSTGESLSGKRSELPAEKEQKRSERPRRSETARPETVNSSESIPVSDEDSDAMVDDPNDEDFVPFRTRRSTRMSLRAQMAQRAARSSFTKMTCANCRTPLQKGQTAYQRKGLPQLFCSSSCLTTFSKKPPGKKICTFCKKEIWNTKDSVVAQIGSGGSFHEFCTSVCLSLYEAQQHRPAPQSADASDTSRCSVCHKPGEIQHEVSNGNVVHRICSDACFTKFRATKGLKTNCCDNCGLYIYNKGLPLEYLFHEGQQKRFCNSACLNSYKKKNTRVYPCMWCKTLCKNFDMLPNVDRSGKMGLFCSICCTTSHKVKQSGLVGPPRPCSFCRKSLSEPCYYNKTDRVVYQFCSPSCWTKFQRTSPEGGIHLNCHYCHNLFSGKPEILDWQDKVYQFCCKDCCEDFKRLRGVVSQCEHCKQEKLLHEKIRFSGVEKNFCSEGQTSEPKPAVPSPQKAETNMLSAKASSAQTSPAVPPPAPPLVPATPRKNKAAMCKPLMQNRGVSCKFEMKSKGCQTEADWKPQLVVLPIPVPIFVPVPMHMYCQKVPVPFSMPVPVPVPMFLPTTLESTEKIVETIEELKVKIPSNPLEADILAMAEMIAEAEELDKASSDLCDLVSNQSAEGLLEDCDLFGPARDDVLAMAVKMANVLDEPGQDLEADFPKNPLDINPSVDFLFDCGLVGPDDVSTEQDLPRAVRKGQKRLVLSESCSRDSMSSQPSCTVLNYSYGVNAWKSWVQAKYAGGESSKGEELRFGPKPMRIKEDILACSAAELNYGLAQFVKEITRPNGERYEPDSIYYLCLGIQQYLLENNRMVNIFTDLYYLTFVQELNKSLSGWQPTILPNNTVFSRVEEEHLWECKQLGVYSPFVLLNTLMFFNTKFFGLQTAEEHMQLSFTNVVRQSRKCTTARGMTKVVSIRYYAPAKQKKSRDSGSGKRKREEEVPVLEQRENRMNPLRCPVKFYEFYLSKCPESLRNRSDVFYLQPERSCIAESPLWYSVIPMDRSMLESMLNRILAVREIYEEHSRLSSLEDDMD